MPNWKKLIVSGSDATLNSLYISTSVTASIFSGSQHIGSHTGSLLGTASWANNTVSASYASTSSWALNFITSSVTSASYAGTASFVTGSIHTAGNLALSASYAGTASFVTGSIHTAGNLALSASYALNISGGASTYIPLWNSATTLSSSVIYQSSNNIGVGITSPNYKLHVHNTAANDNYIQITGNSTGTATTDGFLLGVNTTNDAILLNRENTNTYFYTNNTIQMTIAAGGTVGIGATPVTTTRLLVGDAANSYAAGFYGVNGDTLIALGNTTGNTGSIQAVNTAGAVVRNLVINPSGGNIGLFQANPRYRLDVSGSARVQSGSLAVGTATPSVTIGRIDASNDVVAFSTSDINFKTNLSPISGAIDRITQISGYEFDWIPNQEHHGFEGRDIGVIAQEIEKVLPQVVTTRASGYKGVKYEKIVPLLIQAIKEQQKQIEDLQNQINYLM